MEIITENILIPNEEINLLKNILGKKMVKISSADPTDFLTDFVWTLYLDFNDTHIEIERADIIAKLFDSIEDGGQHKISIVQHEFNFDDFIKTINRIVDDVLIISNVFNFDADNENEGYKITYHRAILFQFNDCRLVIEKRWLFSLAGFVVRLESLDTENFGLYNETQFWYDSDNMESDGRIPSVTQNAYSIKKDKFISTKHGLNL